MTELNVNAPSLDTQNIGELQNPNGNPPASQPTTTEPPASDPVAPTWEQPSDPANQMSVDDLYKQQEAEAAQQRIKDNDAKLLEEIWGQIKKEVDNDTPSETDPQTPPAEPANTDGQPKVEVDETGQGLKALHAVKEHADKKINDAERGKWEAETRLEAQIKLHDAEKAQLEETIAKLSREKIELKHNSIPSEDEAVVKYNYLRQWFKENSDDAKWSKDLGKFHLKFAANYYDVDPSALEQLIVQSKNRKNNQQDAMAWGYNSWGWVPPQSNKNSRRVNNNTLLNKDLM